jgi:hypothetical protein
MRRLIDFINVNDNKQLNDTFNLSRTLIVNSKDAIEGITKLIGFLSNETVIKLLPYDVDAEQELKRLEDEREPMRLE